MTGKYRVLVVGMGKRGMHHAATFHANDRFVVAGICDIDRARLEAAAPKLGYPETSADASALAQAVRPDVFCFCTLPNLRLEMIQIGVASGARLIAFEKPIAMSSAEAMEIKKALEGGGVKAVVSHQHRYGAHYRKVKEVIASGALGRIHTVYGTATGWMMHMLSHLIDYMRWYNNGAEAEWVMAQASGRGKLADRCARFPGLHRRVHSVRQRRARDCGMRRRGAGRARGGLLVAQVPDRGARDGWFRRGADGGRVARGDQDRLIFRSGKHELRPGHASVYPGHGRVAGR